MADILSPRPAVIKGKAAEQVAAAIIRSAKSGKGVQLIKEARIKAPIVKRAKER